MVTGLPLLVIFVLSVSVLLISIIRYKMNPFFSLLLTSILTAFLVQMPIQDIAPTITAGFGNTLKGIGIVIGLGIIFGKILSESKATESIAKGLLKLTGIDRSPLAVAIAGFLISIPVYMDAAFVIMMPIVRYVAKVTKKSLLMYICALGVGTIVGHSIVIPTPGPLAVAANMNADISGFLLYSIIAGLGAIIVGGFIYGQRFKNTKLEIENDSEVSDKDFSLVDDKKVPGFGISMLCLLFPIILILLSNIVKNVLPATNILYTFFGFVGEKNIALLLGCILALIILRKYIIKSFNEIIVSAADSAGLILLITGAGGAFGKVISSSGIGDYLVATMASINITPVILGFILSALLRVSQGSTTVALVTTSSILGPAIINTDASPILVGLAICAGGIGFSLPNDSGFWVLSRFSGISVKDTLKSWTIGGSIAAITAFAIILLLDAINNMIGLPFLN